MSVSPKYFLHQGPTIGAFLNSAIGIARQQLLKEAPSTTPPQVPGPRFESVSEPLPNDLLNDYVRHVGGNPGAYKKTVPAHLFPQWLFPLSQKTLKDLPYPIAKVVNGGCRLEIHGPLPRGEQLVSAAQLTELDDNGSRAVMVQRMTSGTRENPELITASFYPIVPLGKSSGGAKKKKESPIVPEGARELTRFKLAKNAGFEFAKLTGDINPIHWVDAYAKANGFRGVILHGFSTMARAIEGLNRHLLFGDVSRLKSFDARFVRPLHLPADVGLYIDGKGGVYVGMRPGGPAYLSGSYELRP